MKFFFKAMSGSASYAGGGKATPVPGMPGWKQFRVEHRPLLLIDRYMVLPGFSLGHTILQDDTEARLFMHYEGFYPKEVTGFLKQVLLKGYQAGEFCGGRGPSAAESEEYLYMNSWRWLGNPDEMRFVGKEQVFRSSDESELGYHHYGGTILPPVSA